MTVTLNLQFNCAADSITKPLVLRITLHFLEIKEMFFGSRVLNSTLAETPAVPLTSAAATVAKYVVDGSNPLKVVSRSLVDDVMLLFRVT